MVGCLFSGVAGSGALSAAIFAPELACKGMPAYTSHLASRDRSLKRSLSLRRQIAAAFAGLAAFVAAAPARAHPHVWVTVRSQVAFSPDGKVASIIHDWTFDEMYSSFAVQGLAKPGELAKREDFAPLAKENAGGLADIGYFTTVKINGKAVEFGNVTDYWMEERPDHLVTFHVVLPLKTPQAPGKFFTLLVADPEFFIDFEFDDKDAIKLTSAPEGCSSSLTKPGGLAADDKKKLDESFFTNLSPGANFGFKMASRVIIACP
jgi:ABC-type uncharacterized transport system substrate-binding protein